MLLDLDLTDRRVVAVGGGPVTARRVAAFLEAGARVTVIAPQVCPQVAAHVAVGAVEHAARAWDGPADLDQGIVLNGRANIVPTDNQAIAFSRSAAQTLNIVYLNRTAVSSGGFFPAGVNGTIRASGGPA